MKKFNKDNMLFMLIMFSLFIDIDIREIYSMNDEEFFKLLLIFIILSNNIYVITRTQVKQNEIYYNDWVICDID
tara:strand:+ start:699 stop:920 length:222 start_codon:yes stop_codon:yes gene_type:complete